MNTFGDDKKIKAFLRNCNEYEFHLLHHTVNLVKQIRNIIKKHNITPKEFCIALMIPLSQYKAYYGGSYEYSLKDICALEVLWQEKEIELAKKKEIIKISERPISDFKKKK